MDKNKLKNLLKKYGHSSISFQTLMDGLSCFKVAGVDGYIAYLKSGRSCLAIGDPICSEKDFTEIVGEFVNFCQKQKLKAIFLASTPQTRDLFKQSGLDWLKIGTEGIFDLNKYNFQGGKMKDLRRFISHARKLGIKVRRLQSNDQNKFNQVRNISRNWLATRRIKSLSFLLNLNPLNELTERIIFTAEDKNQVVAFLSCSPIYGRQGYYLEDFIKVKNAPKGVSELLFYEAINYLKTVDCQMVTLGPALLSNLQPTDNPRYRQFNTWLRLFFKKVSTFYNFKGIYNFKARFKPSHWEDVYICFYPPRLKRSMFLDIIKAFSPEGLTEIIISKIKKILIATGHKAANLSAGTKFRWAGTILGMVLVYWLIVPIATVFGAAVKHGPTNEKLIALTFDDGPYGEATAKILDILDARKTKATFFLVGKNALKYPDLVKREAAAGHLLGNHTYDHSRLLSLQSPKKVAANILQADQAISGVSGGLHPRYFRPPYGLKSPLMLSELRHLGYQVILWNDATDDYDQDQSAEAITKHIVKKLKPGAIVDLHDGRDVQINYPRDNLIKALPMILDKITQLGYTPVTLDVLLGMKPYK